MCVGTNQVKVHCVYVSCSILVSQKQPWCRSHQRLLFGFFGILAYQHAPRQKPLTSQFLNTLVCTCRKQGATLVSLCAVCWYIMAILLFVCIFLVVTGISYLMDSSCLRFSAYCLLPASWMLRYKDAGHGDYSVSSSVTYSP